YSLIAIEWAQAKAKQRPADAPGSVAFVRHNATDLEFLGKDFFDFVLDGFLLHSLIGEDRQTYLRQVRRVLKPKGVFMVQSFCAEDVSASEWEGWNIDPVTRLQHDENGVVMKYIGNCEGLLAELRQAGFEVLRHKISPVCGGMLVAACRQVQSSL
ncbi:MAG: class I SAM-dependent methyltransferase, partial [Candidatus Sumerlaeota bacterium]